MLCPSVLSDARSLGFFAPLASLPPHLDVFTSLNLLLTRTADLTLQKLYAPVDLVAPVQLLVTVQQQVVEQPERVLLRPPSG